MLMDKTAAELADALDAMEYFPHNTAGLSMLDEATLAFRAKSVELDEAQQAFVEARFAHKDSYSLTSDYYSDESWQLAMQAARRLAALLRKLGDVRIARCKRQAGWGTCNLPLDELGECHSTLGHLDTQPT